LARRLNSVWSGKILPVAVFTSRPAKRPPLAMRVCGAMREAADRGHEIGVNGRFLAEPSIA
jgi:hypothetical protein